MQRAIEEGADFIETDILSSKDGVLICFHDVILDLTTDVANHTEFANRQRTYNVQGFNVTGFFTGMEAYNLYSNLQRVVSYLAESDKFFFIHAVDFTLKELKKLRVKQRYDFRDQQYNG